MTSTTLNVNDQGRVTIPAQLRRELGIGPGSSMIAYIDDGRLVLEPRAHLVTRIQQAARAARTEHGSVVDELIAAKEHE